MKNHSIYHSPNLPPFKKGEGPNFSKMAVMGGGGGGRNGNGGGRRVGFIMGGRKFTYLFYEDPFPYIAYSSHLFQISSTPTPHFPDTSNPRPQCSFCCHVSLAKWGDHATFDELFYLIIKWIYTSCTI